jgi:hypothetical protein
MADTESLNHVLGVAAAYWTIGLVAVTLVTLYLILRSGRSYSVHDTEAHAVEYAGLIKEGHGGLTAFLWVSYVLMAVWTVLYFAQHASEFSIMVTGMG